MRSDNLQFPHITANFLMVATDMVVMVVMVVCTGQDTAGQDRTELTFKLDFPGNL